LTDLVFLILLIVHVGSIVGWMGAALLFVSVVNPALPTMGMEGRADFIVSVLPRYMRYVLANSVVAVIAGLSLFVYTTQVSTSLMPTATALLYIQTGAIIGLVAFVLVLALLLPSEGKLVNLLKEMRKGGQSGTAGAEQGSMVQVVKIQSRVKAAANVIATLLVVVLILMIIGGTA
jgi:hypothetical protein